jgi:hypothetical protein
LLAGRRTPNPRPCMPRPTSRTPIPRGGLCSRLSCSEWIGLRRSLTCADDSHAIRRQLSTDSHLGWPEMSMRTATPIPQCTPPPGLQRRSKAVRVAAIASGGDPNVWAGKLIHATRTSPGNEEGRGFVFMTVARRLPATDTGSVRERFEH